MSARLRILVLAAAFAATASLAHAQGVGINATGAAADTSAILDLTSSSKGLLVPRMTAAQRGAIVLPATGLVVYQTDGTAGLYFNAGTSASPSWQAVGANAGAAQWSVSGSNLYYSAGKVAIGTTPGTYGLSVMDATNGVRVQTNTSGSAAVSVGGFGTVGVDAPGVVNGRLSLLENGNLGLGVANPTNKLSFAATLGKKISLYPGASGDVGFGVAGNRLQIYADNPNADVAIGYDAAGTFNERFALKPNGALAVNGNTGAAGQVLQSNGSGAAATWVSPTNTLYANTYNVYSNNVLFDFSSTTETPLPDMSQTFAVSGNAKVIVAFDVQAYNTSCTFCSATQFALHVLLDGVLVRGLDHLLQNGTSETSSGHYTLFVGPGSHTVSLAAVWKSGPQLSLGGGVWAGSNLDVQVIPQ